MSEYNHISFVEILEGFKPISLDEMDAVKLMNRIDTKYLTDEETLVRILRQACAAGYMVLETDGLRINPYDSLYYDTDGLKMYYDHRNRKLVRQKVRTRTYLTSGITFLEIKRKNNKGRTKKKRIGIPADNFNNYGSNAEATGYLASHSDFSAHELSPVVETLFFRITLVNPARTERLTIDTCLNFKNHRTELEASLRDAVIIELKQDGRASSQMKNILLDLRVKPRRVSKYCIAVTMTDPGVRPGRFKQKVHIIEKIINQKAIVL
jgi:hypothetical protein